MAQAVLLKDVEGLGEAGTAIDPQAARLADRVGDLLGGHRAEELAVLAGAVMEGEDGLRQQGRGLLGALGRLLLRALLGLAPALGFLQRRPGGGLGELAGQQVVAQVARRDVDGIAAAAKILDVLEKDRLRHQRSPT